MIERNLRKGGIIAALLLVISLCAVASDQCSTCGEASDVSVFESAQSGRNPYTLGLPIGASAPLFDGCDAFDGKTLLVAINTIVNIDTLPMIRIWSQELSSLRVIVLLSGLESSQRASCIDVLGPDVQIITEPVSTIACAMYQAGSSGSPASFLIDSAGMIVYRQVGITNKSAMPLDRVVRAFADSGSIPEDTLLQHILWYGDAVPWPPFDLVDRNGETVSLDTGRPLVFYSGSYLGRDEAAYNDLIALLDVFGDEVDFVLRLHAFREEESLDMWTFAQLAGLDSVYPDWYAMDFDAFLAISDLPGRRAEVDEQARKAEADGWRVIYDDFRWLAFSWVLHSQPGVMILDAGGMVVFPFTTYPVDTSSGVSVSAPGAMAELSEILDQIVEAMQE